MIVNVLLVKIGTERTSTYGPMESATTALSTPPRMTRSIELFKQTFFTIKRSGLDIFWRYICLSLVWFLMSHSRPLKFCRWLDTNHGPLVIGGTCSANWATTTAQFFFGLLFLVLIFCSFERHNYWIAISASHISSLSPTRMPKEIKAQATFSNWDTFSFISRCNKRKHKKLDRLRNI